MKIDWNVNYHNIRGTFSFCDKVEKKAALDCMYFYERLMNVKLYKKNFYKRNRDALQSTHTLVDSITTVVDKVRYDEKIEIGLSSYIKRVNKSEYVCNIKSLTNTHFHSFFWVHPEKSEDFISYGKVAWKIAVNRIVHGDKNGSKKAPADICREFDPSTWLKYVSNQDDKGNQKIICDITSQQFKNYRKNR